MTRTRLTLAALLAIGVAVTVANARLPIVRNSLVYAGVVERLDDHRLAAWEVCSDPAQVKKQGCGFGIFAVPLVASLGMNVGLKVASWIGTVLYLFALIGLFRRFNPRFGLGDRDLPLELLATCFNPLIVYQFWSAYPDTLFAALYLTSFVLADRMIVDPAPRLARLAPAYVAVMALAVVVKPAGLILFPLHALFALWHRGRLAELWRREPRRVAILAASAGVLLAWIALGKLGWNPLLNLNEGEYDLPVRYLDSVRGIGVLWLVVFGALLLVAVPRLSVSRADGAILALLVAHVHIIMVFHAASFNLRHYLPAIAFATPYIVRALRRVRRPRLASGVVAAFIATNTAAIAAFNAVAVNRALDDAVPGSVLADYGYLDNLRLGAHRRVADALARINRELPPSATLIYVSGYYRDAANGIYQHAGLLRKDLHVVYSSQVRGVAASGEAWVFLADAVSGALPDASGSPVIGDRWLFRIGPSHASSNPASPGRAKPAEARQRRVSVEQRSEERTEDDDQGVALKGTPPSAPGAVSCAGAATPADRAAPATCGG